ncbi:MAG: hypothetical protein JWQ42_3720 [Edaphobacter sp.]|jgi:hypothetical protein|nr:hypothetical protein [Edaphobacter sp.]
MSDGREEREEQERRREWERRQDADDLVDRKHQEDWEQEREDS